MLAGLSLAVFGSATASHASSMRWGAFAPSPDMLREVDRKPKPDRAVTPRPGIVPRETGRPETTGSGGVGTRLFAPFPATADPVAGKPARKVTKDKAAKKSAVLEAPVIPDGPLHVIVSVTAQTASLYANGQFVASTKVSTGTKTHPTPLGVFTVLQKNRHHVSNLYGPPMPYMQRLTWSGTALHTGPLPGYPASHGCIRLTNEFAQLLWKATRLGARVIVTRDDVKPGDISHTQLAMTIRPPRPAPEVADTTGALVRTADAVGGSTGSAPNLTITAPAPIFSGAGAASLPSPDTARPAAKTARPAPVSIFISRKDGKVYVRQAMKPLFDMPLALSEPDRPLGTHVYTAMELKDGSMRWTAVSIPSSFARETVKVARSAKGMSKTAVTPAPEPPAPSAAEALSRLNLPEDMLERLAGLVIPGSSLIVSDNGLSHETGTYTDFIVLTR